MNQERPSLSSSIHDGDYFFGGTPKKVLDYLNKHLEWKQVDGEDYVSRAQLNELLNAEFKRWAIEEVMEDAEANLDGDRYKWIIGDLHVMLTESQLRPALEAAFDPEDRDWEEKAVIDRRTMQTIPDERLSPPAALPEPESAAPATNPAVEVMPPEEWNAAMEDAMQQLASALLRVGVVGLTRTCTDEERQRLQLCIQESPDGLMEACSDELQIKIVKLAEKTSMMAQIAISTIEPPKTPDLS